MHARLHECREQIEEKIKNIDKETKIIVKNTFQL